MLVRIANRDDTDQTAALSDLGLPCLYRPFWKATSVQNLRTFTVFCLVNTIRVGLSNLSYNGSQAEIKVVVSL